MIYQLTTGKTIEISLKQFLEMGDDEFQEEIKDLTSWNYGTEISDPFYMSILKGEPRAIKENPDEEEPILGLDEVDMDTKLDELDAEILD